MTSPPQSPTKIRPGSRDTGFPEPFCGQRNTTLPHPDADLSPGATISQEDVAVINVLKRSRRSFLSKHKKTLSHGKITPEMEATWLAMQVDEAGARAEPSPLADLVPEQRPRASSLMAGRASRDGADSFASGESPTTDDNHSTASRRKGFLRKFGFHKH